MLTKEDKMKEIEIIGKVVKYDPNQLYMHAPDGMKAQIFDMPDFLKSLQKLSKEEAIKTLEGEINACGTWSRVTAGFMWKFAAAYGQSVPGAFSRNSDADAEKIGNTVMVLEDLYHQLSK
jgi:hypothetical protein